MNRLEDTFECKREKRKGDEKKDVKNKIMQRRNTT
jgi:hypothetical protein